MVAAWTQPGFVAVSERLSLSRVSAFRCRGSCFGAPGLLMFKGLLGGFECIGSGCFDVGQASVGFEHLGKPEECRALRLCSFGFWASWLVMAFRC